MSPAKYLALVNVVCVGVGFLQAIITARLIGPEGYGIIAVIAGTNATVLNFLDVRLTDLAAKLYYREEPQDESSLRAYRSSVLQVCLIGTGAISLGLCILGLGATILVAGVFTAAPIRLEWMVAQTLILALGNWTNSLNFLQRFSGRFYLMGNWKFLTQILSTGVFLWVVLATPNLDGYYSGGLLAAVLGTALAIVVSLFIWVRCERFPISFSGLRLALPDYLRGGRFMLFGNLLGYTKLLHRSADVLAVAYFADDRVTGLYRFARSLTDGLYVLFDALNQVYFPRFLEMLKQRAHSEYRRLAVRFVYGTLAITVAVLAMEAVLLPFFMGVVLVDRFSGAEGAVLVLTVPFLFVTGLSTWMWPLFVHSGKLGSYTIFSYLACLAQYGVLSGMFLISVHSALNGALGYLAYYLVLMALSYLLLRKWYPDVVPGRNQRAVVLGPSTGA